MMERAQPPTYSHSARDCCCGDVKPTGDWCRRLNCPNEACLHSVTAHEIYQWPDAPLHVGPLLGPCRCVGCECGGQDIASKAD